MASAPLNLFLPLLFFLLLSPTLSQPAPTTRSGCLSQSPLICHLTPTPSNKLFGTVILRPYFRFGMCQVRILANLFNLFPPGPHGIHIHTYGDLSTPDAASAGGHFTNPRGIDVPHGYPDSPQRHWGDFGNVTASRRGRAIFKHIDTVITLPGIVGRSIVVHAGEDKGPMFQPSGDSGSRLAMCVIGFANTELLSTR